MLKLNKILNKIYIYINSFSNIFEISIFPDCKYHRTLTYPVKQILVQELEAERLRRAANAIKNVTQNKNENAVKENTTTNEDSREDLVAKTRNNIVSIESKEIQTKEIVSIIFFIFLFFSILF